MPKKELAVEIIDNRGNILALLYSYIHTYKTS